MGRVPPVPRLQFGMTGILLALVIPNGAEGPVRNLLVLARTHSVLIGAG
jgi:hypothetical protein